MLSGVRKMDCDLLKELEKIEAYTNTNCEGDLPFEIERMYAYYMLELIICKLTGKDSKEAIDGLKKVSLLMEENKE